MAKAKDDKAKKADAEEAKPEGEIAPEKPKRSMKKLLLFIVAPAVLLFGGAGAYFFLFAGGDEEEAHAEEVVAEAPPAFFDLPEMLVNLAGSTDAKPVFLKLAVALELAAPEDIPLIEPVLPRVLDNFQTFLRELRVEDLSGSAGMFRLKEELLRRVNLSVAPTEVRDVLFKQMLIQ
ncbi:MAG TPA: flagellar basal body-associated FliL family protein [Hyphomonas sp.]|nr:flagellar basal body-associated FliL family protein [Hyphomonas sp.]